MVNPLHSMRWFGVPKVLHQAFTDTLLSIIHCAGPLMFLLSEKLLDCSSRMSLLSHLWQSGLQAIWRELVRVMARLGTASYCSVLERPHTGCGWQRSAWDYREALFLDWCPGRRAVYLTLMATIAPV